MREERATSGPEAFLYAHPAGHSLSPQMHNAAFAAAGLAGHYRALDIAPERLPAALEALRRPGVLGANLSLPHKEAALPLLDTLSEAARAIGAVNTVINVGERLHGDNTDAPGLLLALEAAGDKGGAAVVLGAGGAARSAVWALRTRGRQVYVINRTLARARALTEALGGEVASVQGAPWEQVGLVVNASSAGLNAPEQSPLPDFDWARLPGEALVYDMVYKPAQTRLMRGATATGLRAENGLGMLAQQARLAFELWTGQLLDADIFWQALTGKRPGHRE